MKTCYEYRTDINAILSNNCIRLWICPQIINKEPVLVQLIIYCTNRDNLREKGVLHSVGERSERNITFSEGCYKT